jgi:hypothetical protein
MSDLSKSVVSGETFHVKLQSDNEPSPAPDPARSLSVEVQLLRQQVAQLCVAVRGLTTLQSVMDKKLDAALNGGVGADFAVLG